MSSVDRPFPIHDGKIRICTIIRCRTQSTIATKKEFNNATEYWTEWRAKERWASHLVTGRIIRNQFHRIFAAALWFEKQLYRMIKCTCVARKPQLLRLLLAKFTDPRTLTMEYPRFKKPKRIIINSELMLGSTARRTLALSKRPFLVWKC